MNCDAWVLDGAPAFTEKGPWERAYPAPPTFTPITSAALAEALASNQAIVIDLSPLRFYQAGHVPGAWFALRSQLATAATILPISRRSNQKIVLTDQSGRLAAYAAPELQQIFGKTVYVLTDEKDLGAIATWQNAGNAAWKNAGYNLQKGPTNLASPAIDRFQRPYEAPEGEDVAPDQDVTFDLEKIKAYLAWLSGSNLLKKLQLDGTSGFHVV